MVECFHGCCLIAVAIDEVVVIRNPLWTGRHGAGANEGAAPLVRWMLALGVVEVCAALATHIGFVSQRPVIVDEVLGIMGAGWLAHRLGELLGKGWAVEGWGIQPFLVAVADVDTAVIPHGLREVSGEAVSGLIRALAPAHLDKELGGGGVGDGFSI